MTFQGWLKLTIVALLSGSAYATPWYVTWNGDDYPENEGWTRYATDPPAQRWLEDGKLSIDSRAAPSIHEEYGQLRPGEMTPDAGEAWHMSWRIKVDEVIPNGSMDPGIWVWSDDQWAASFSLGIDRIWSDREPAKSAPFTAGQFHDFTFQSPDMRTYQLWIDNTPAWGGQFTGSLFDMPGMGWGDITSGRSLAEWDYVEAGMVPEPGAGVWLALVLYASGPLKRSAVRR